jgi:hypothetical protein
MIRVLGTPVKEYLPSLALVAITVIYLITGYGYSPTSRAIPVGVAWVTLVLLGLVLIARTKTPFGMALSQWLNAGQDRAAVAVHANRPLGTELMAAGWLVVAVVMMFVIGIFYSVPAYVFLSIAIRGRRPLWVCAVTAVAAALMAWILFKLVLQLELYPGLLFAS